MIGDKRRQEENRGGDICKGTSKNDVKVVFWTIL